MLSRKANSIVEFLLDTWCQGLEETLNEVYEKNSIDSQKLSCSRLHLPR